MGKRKKLNHDGSEEGKRKGVQTSEREVDQQAPFAGVEYLEQKKSCIHNRKTNAEGNPIESVKTDGTDMLEGELRLEEEKWFAARPSCLSHHNRIIHLILEKLEPAEMNRFKSSCFGHLLEIEDLKFSGQLAHSILLRQTHKDADEGMQFVIGDTITTFSEQDFALVTGLKCGELPPLEEVPANNIWLKEQYFPGMDEITVADLERAFEACSDSEDSFRLAMVLFVEGVLNGREVTNNVGTRFLSLVQDFEQFNNYPWGTFSYEHTIHCMNSVLRGRDEAFEKRQSQKEQHNAERYSLKGFPLAFQAWTYEIMPDLAKHRFVHKNIGSPPYPRILKWKYPKSHPSYNKLRNVIFGSKKAPEVIPLIPGIEEMQQPYWTWGDNIRATFNHRPKLHKPGAGTNKATYNVPLKQGTLYQNPGEVIHLLSHNNSILDEIAGIKNLISKEIRGLRREIRTLRNDVCSRGVGSYTSDRQLLLELIKSVRGQDVKVQRRSGRRMRVTKLGGTQKAFMPLKPRQRRVSETYSAIWNSDTPLKKDDVGFENVASQRCNVKDPVAEQLRGKGGATTLTDEDLEQAPNSTHIMSSTMELDVSEKLVNCNKAVGKESNAQGTVTTEKDESTTEFETGGNAETHKGRSLYNVHTAAQPICSALKESLSLRETVERFGEERFLDGHHLINNTVSRIGAAPEEHDVILDDKLHNPDEAVNNTTFPSTALTSDTSSTMPNQNSGHPDEQCHDSGGKLMHEESDTQTNVPALSINEGDIGIQPDRSSGHLVRDEQQLSVEHPGLAVGLIDGPLRRSARIRKPGPQIRTPFAGANPNKKRKAGDYNPFAFAPKHAKNELANFINRWSQSPNDTINVCGEVVDQRFILDVIEVGAHLSSLHMDMGLSLLRHRQSEYPSVFGTRWTSVDCFFHQMLLGTGGFPAFSMFEDSSMWKPDDRMIQYVLGRRPNWSRRWDNLDLVFIPVNLSEVHWVTASADLVNCKITVYDSKMTLHTSGQINEIFKPLSHLVPHLLDTAGFQKNTADRYGSLGPWPVYRAEHVPQQTTDDCGLFCLKMVDCLSSGFPLKQWTQTEIQEFRMKLAIEFMQGASYV